MCQFASAAHINAPSSAPATVGDRIRLRPIIINARPRCYHVRPMYRSKLWASRTVTTTHSFDQSLRMDTRTHERVPVATNQFTSLLSVVTLKLSRALMLCDAESDDTTEKTAAFDLLDALSRSGALCIEDASLHVVIAATHSFDQSLMDTVVEGNVNPIERVERSTLIMASTLHGVAASELVAESQLEHIRTYAPSLFALTDI
eukprot:gene30470-37690_t